MRNTIGTHQRLRVYRNKPVSYTYAILWTVAAGLLAWTGYGVGTTAAINEGFDPAVCDGDPQCIASVKQLMLNFQLPYMVGFFAGGSQFFVDLHRFIPRDCFNKIFRPDVQLIPDATTPLLVIRNRIWQPVRISLSRLKDYMLVMCLALLPSLPQLLSIQYYNNSQLQDPDFQFKLLIVCTVAAMFASVVHTADSLNNTQQNYALPHERLTIEEETPSAPDLS